MAPTTDIFQSSAMHQIPFIFNLRWVDRLIGESLWDQYPISTDEHQDVRPIKKQQPAMLDVWVFPRCWPKQWTCDLAWAAGGHLQVMATLTGNMLMN